MRIGVLLPNWVGDVAMATPALRTLRRELPDARIVAVTHGDVIKAALFRCLGLSLDHIGRVEISPAGLSTIAIGDWGSKVLSVNEAVSR